MPYKLSWQIFLTYFSNPFQLKHDFVRTLYALSLDVPSLKLQIIL
jgi:hypothetical protein